jgi:glucose-6-phosphate dehydrogenase assembly protein OpcA
MKTVEEPREFLSGKLNQVDVARIENELRGLWQQATNSDAGIAGDVVRAVSFTLILFSTDEDVEQELSGVIEEIMTHHPCRAILALDRMDKPHAMNAWVTARCHLMGDGKHVCSEQITVHADGAGPDELSSVVTPLVLSDLPVVLWWRSRNLAHPVMEALHRCSRKVIFDSGYQPFATGVLQQAADIVIQKADCIWLSDLNWRRLNGWRSTLAEAFDGFPMEPQYLERIRKVTMQVSAFERSDTMSTQALLLTGWLCSRLNWRHERDKTFKDKVGFEFNEKKFDVEFVRSDANLGAKGSIEAVFMEFDDGRQLDVRMEKNGESYLLTASDPKTQSKESTRVDPHFSEGVLIGQELELMTRDRLFEQSLLVAGEITRVIK